MNRRPPEPHSGALPGCATPRRFVVRDMLSYEANQFNSGDLIVAKKQKYIKPARELTKHQLAKWEQQKRLQRIALITGAVFVALVIGFAVYGYYTNEVVPLNQPVVKVNDVSYDMDYYIKALRIYGKDQDPSQLSTLADVVVGIIQSNALIKKGAYDSGIKIENTTIDAEVKRLNLPNDSVSHDIVYSQILAKKLLDERFSLTVPVSAEQVHVQAMLLESENVALELAKRLGAGEDFSALAKEFSWETQTRSSGGELGWLPKGLSEMLVGSKVLEEAAFSMEPGQLSQPSYDADIIKDVGYWLIEVADKKTEQGIQTKAMLLGSRAEAESVRVKLMLNEDFAALAKLHSQHVQSKDNGGDLGWLQPGMMSTTFDKIAFTLDPGMLSEPVQDSGALTKGGYWLVKVLEKDANRQLEEQLRQQLINRAFENWLLTINDASTVETYLDTEGKQWALTEAFGGGRQ